MLGQELVVSLQSRREQAEPTDIVQRLTGWPPRTFATWAATYADAFRSAPSVVGAG